MLQASKANGYGIVRSRSQSSLIPAHTPDSCHTHTPRTHRPHHFVTSHTSQHPTQHLSCHMRSHAVTRGFRGSLRPRTAASASRVFRRVRSAPLPASTHQLVHSCTHASSCTMHHTHTTLFTLTLSHAYPLPIPCLLPGFFSYHLIPDT